MSKRPEVGAKPKVAVSSCLLGKPVRFDGGHCADRFVQEVLADHVELVPVCPETEIGMGVPRPTVRLVEGEGGERLVDPRSGRDWTGPMEAFATPRTRDLVGQGVLGMILKKGSPSCGIERIKVYTRNGDKTGLSRPGVFARAAAEAAPDLPIEEEGRLNDVGLRHRFLTRVFARFRLERLRARKFRPRDLVEFHSREKLLLMAHRVESYRSLGRLVAQAGDMDPGALLDAYATEFLAALATRSSRGRHVNVLQHCAGYFKTRLEPIERRNLDASIRGYFEGKRSYLEPWTLLRHQTHRFGEAYLADQTYFEPYPEALLRASDLLYRL